MEQPEEYEHIPWSALGDDHRDRRNRFLYLAAGILAAATIGAVAGRALLTPEIHAEEPALQAGDAAPEPEPPPTTTTTTGTASSLYTEADLMAVLGGEQTRAVAAGAEWFVTDYFTVDGDRRGSADVVDALPLGAPMPPLPHDGGETGVTYVEWARAVRVTELAPGRYRATVAYRAVASSGDGDFDRLPVRAVDLVMVLGPDGGAAVVDLPTPGSLPSGLDVAPWQEASSEVPPAIAAAALDEARRWGREAEVVGAVATEPGWRVVVSITDESGKGWPMTVWLDPEGLVVPPGYGP